MVGAIVIIALGAWLYSVNVAPMPSSENATTTAFRAGPVPSPATQTAKPATKGVPHPSTHQSLLTQTGSYECDYTQVQSSGQSTNVIYIYSGKLRGEFRTADQNGVTTANLLVYDGHYLYQWREGMSTGTKTELTSLSQLPLVIPRDLTSGNIYGSSYESVGWQCHTWLTNKSLLTPPSYVAFAPA